MSSEQWPLWGEEGTCVLYLHTQTPAIAHIPNPSTPGCLKATSVSARHTPVFTFHQLWLQPGNPVHVLPHPASCMKVSYWREFVAYKMAEWIQETVPTCTVELELAGNDTTLTVELTDEERKLLSDKLDGFLGRWVR